MATLNISIPDEMRQWIDYQIDAATDLVRFALIEGEQSGESGLTIKEIIQSEKQANQEC